MKNMGGNSSCVTEVVTSRNLSTSEDHDEKWMLAKTAGEGLRQGAGDKKK